MLWLTALCGQSQVTRYLLAERDSNIVSAQKIIAVSRYCYQQQPGFGFWATHNETGALIGLFSLLPRDTPQDEPEMGVRLLPAFWSRWYGVEGGRALCRHAFGVLELERVHAHTHPENLAAQAIARRVGFELGPRCTYFNETAQRLISTREYFQRRQQQQIRDDAVDEPATAGITTIY